MADTKELRAQLLKIDAPVFAVVDGAQFDDLPAALFDGDFVHRPLYVERGLGDRDRDRTAPQLVRLDRDAAQAESEDGETEPRLNPAVLDRLLELIGERPAAVFWECPAGGEALYRHLRTINMVLLPRTPAAPQGDTHELVLFRHADANVAAQVLPAMTDLQFARLFGPATRVLFAPDKQWGEPFNWALRPDNVAAPPGPLKLERATVDRIEIKRGELSRGRVARFLKRHLPPQLRRLNDETIDQVALESERTGRDLGIRTERGHARWAYLMLLSGGQAARIPEAAMFIRQGPDPDERVKELIRYTAAALRNNDVAGARQ